MVSTAADYLRFARMLLAGGVADDGTRVLSERSVAAMTTDQLEPGRPDDAFLGANGWGYGVEVTAAPARYGWGGGLGTVWSSYPGSGTAAVLFSQRLPPSEPLITAFFSALRPMLG
jgi:CubicO group peptidase (beta-lactamase class C family)